MIGGEKHSERFSSMQGPDEINSFSAAANNYAAIATRQGSHDQ